MRRPEYQTKRVIGPRGPRVTSRPNRNLTADDAGGELRILDILGVATAGSDTALSAVWRADGRTGLLAHGYCFDAKLGSAENSSGDN